MTAAPQRTDERTVPTPVSIDSPRRRGRRTAAIGGAAGALAVAGGAGIWFFSFSPHDSTVTLTADSSKAVPGKSVTLSGLVTPAHASRVVEVAVATSQNGPFRPAGSAVTDAAGRYWATFTPTEAGTTWVRATAVQLERDQAAESAPSSFVVRAPAILSLKASAAAIRTSEKATLTAALTPAGGAVAFEKSVDGESWQPASGVRDSGNGKFTLALGGLSGGIWHFRATAAQTATATAATSKETTVLVEDYKAAGVKYLEIVGRSNRALAQLQSALDAEDGSADAFRRSSAAAEKLSSAYTRAAKEMRAYQGWPRQVRGDVEALVKTNVVVADAYHQMAAADDVPKWDTIYNEAEQTMLEGGRYAAAIREALGLPKRSTD